MPQVVRADVKELWDLDLQVGASSRIHRERQREATGFIWYKWGRGYPKMDGLFGLYKGKVL